MLLSPQSKIGNRKSKISSDDFIRSHQHIGRDRQTDLLGGLEIDNQLELRRLLDWQIGGLGAFQNLVDISRCTPKQLNKSRCVADQSAGLDKFRQWVHA